MTTRRLLFSALILSTFCLVVGSLLKGFIAGALVVLVFGAVGVISLWQRWRWMISLLFLIFAFYSAILMLLQVPFYLPVLAVALMLITWDLEYFRERLERIRSPETARAVQRYHFLHLFPVVAGGVLLSMVALVIHFQLRFAAALILAALAIFLLSRLVAHLAGRSTPPPGIS
ncbi:MAG TPA: hypothetical protein DEQ80_06625 [Anaerolinea thermolimosa]|uniref:Uncharacterized protein n=1 Tax=Anaerolinea thermolimosa TaxID=229919 RepID=A0A3D1JIR3_9CHLR|nr:hypothetical protein [Anaerolinea thermolimosa]GAP06973.1 hypothetical protein ATHL_01839 [Anaerolinea thermolimosa]HCE17516.1 hypothetical protein [Anaerolinea thermolimosa]